MSNTAATKSPKVAYHTGKAAKSFQAHTAALARSLGYKVTTSKEGTEATFVRGDVRVQVTYSAQGFVRKAIGSVSIVPGDSKKFKTLEAKLTELANAES